MDDSLSNDIGECSNAPKNQKNNEEEEAPESKTRRMMDESSSSTPAEKSVSEVDGESKTKEKSTEEAGNNLAELFPKLRSKSKTRNYRRAVQNNSDSSSEEADQEENGNAEVSTAPTAEESVVKGETSESEVDMVSSDVSSPPPLQSSSSSTSQDSHDEDSSDSDSNTDKDDESIPSVMLKQKPKHKWFVVNEVINRQNGVSNNKYGPEMFHSRFYSSLHSVQRLELMYKMEEHQGCVNALNFNSTGTRLASGSDDLRVAVWDWAIGKCLLAFESGHRNNVFQAKFLPMTGDTHIVTCSRDGQIRLAVLSSTGTCRSTRALAQHSLPAHKLSVHADMPQVVLSVGEDGQVLSMDVREPKPTRLCYVKENGRKIGLYSINSNAANHNEFCVSGRDNFVRIYDKRKISSNGAALKKFCPEHLVGKDKSTHVTCAVFNYNGSEVLGTYNDDDIYLFDTRHPEGSDYVHKYEGHRNSATVKGVNFFGPKSEYILSGSDCGHIFFWDKDTEAIVQWMSGDENGVVNCLEPHPNLPILATSGLDDDIKIWVPSCEQEPAMTELKSNVKNNLKCRENDLRSDPDSFDGQMLWFLWRQIRRSAEAREHEQSRTRSRGRRDRAPDGQRNTAREREEASLETSSSDDEVQPVSDDDEDRGGPGRMQCSPS